ncbi:MAG: hypothetical protein M0022_03155, partial [Desulfobacteraceae bacterium]|nr:hypothetical protein [Desulfobacteraceae bacterium]
MTKGPEAVTRPIPRNTSDCGRECYGNDVPAVQKRCSIDISENNHKSYQYHDHPQECRYISI